MSVKKHLSSFQNRKDVADFLGISDAKLRYFLYAKIRDNHYRQFHIVKKSGGIRTICAPSSELKNYQKKFADLFIEVYNPKPCVFGFVKNLSNIDNAQKHLKKREILNIDLKDFFDSINFGRVRGVLMTKPYNVGKEAATIIADILCFNKKLPQGSPCSPIVTNMICRFLDNEILKIIKKSEKSVTYTRYADDLSFSSNYNLPASLVELTSGEIMVGNKLESCIRACGFEIQYSKVRYSNKTTRQEVTGIIVNEKLNLSKVYVKELRGLLYYSLKYAPVSVAKKYIDKNNLNYRFNSKSDEYIEKWFRSLLMGKIYYLMRVKGKSDPIYLRYANRFNTLYDIPMFDTTRSDRLNWACQKNVYVVFEKDFKQARGSAFLVDGIGVVTSKHVIANFSNRVQICKVLYNGELLKLYEKSVSEFYISDSQDYAILPLESTVNGFQVEDSKELSEQETYTLVGYPNYQPKDLISKFDCRITSQSITAPDETGVFDQLVTVDSMIMCGSSGGVVLNRKMKVVGIVAVGVEDEFVTRINNYHGFIRISSVLKEYNLHTISNKDKFK